VSFFHAGGALEENGINYQHQIGKVMKHPIQAGPKHASAMRSGGQRRGFWLGLGVGRVPVDTTAGVSSCARL